MIAHKIPAGTKPLLMAVVHPTDANSLQGAFDAASQGFIEPILIGPEDLIKGVAAQEGIDISAFKLVPTQDDKEAAKKGVELVNSGEAEALMKGFIGTGTFLKPIVSKDGNLRTNRRMSHVFLMDDPDYHKMMYVSDAAVNNKQDLKIKKDITQNAIDVFRSIEGKEPKVALISATEKVTPDIPSSEDAASLKAMADRGEITGGIVDGPFAFDNAVSAASAKLKGIFSPVAGDADILIMPNIETGNVFYKSRSFLLDAETGLGAKRGGIVVGAKVPIVLTSRSADPDTRAASCAMALLHVRNQSGTPNP